MRDLHCHILPGVDDGARDLDESLAMLKAAKAAGITSITCTPHCRDPYFDFEAMWQAFYALEDAADGFPLQMGFEVNYRKLMELGLEWAEVLHFDGSNEFLLELSVGARSSRYDDYERTIFELQGMGYEVIIAHPERYGAIQRDLDLADELVRMGCKLQVSTDFIAGGRFGAERKPALHMLREGMVSYLASDAHHVRHYGYFSRAYERYGDLLQE
ncbi:MAG: phosphoesterase [Coriobacteriales bacterium]|nr:phosphoesterase [Coriobacteriales bacterium]MDO5709543.1 phosphoesterase [Coriobacteriales bacterium]